MTNTIINYSIINNISAINNIILTYMYVFFITDVSVCPSYGGLFVARHTNTWYLRGIRSADPTDKGFCVNHDITFTDLTPYLDWISQYVE